MAKKEKKLKGKNKTTAKTGLQAVIIAAGASTRTYPLTITTPKSMLKIANKTIIEHILDQLDGIAKEVIFVVGYQKEKIMKLGEKYKNIKLKYIEQKEQSGTGHAVLQAEQHINDRFLILNGEDLISKIDIKLLLKHKYAVLAQKVDDPSRFGVFIIRNGCVANIVEKPTKFVSNIANTGAYIVDKKIFSILKELKKTERNEYELTDAIKEFARKEKIYCETVQDYWLPITYPWNLLDANEFFLKKLTKSEIKGIVEKGATIKGNIIVGKGTRVKNGAYVEGPVVIGENCEIGPNCYIRGATSIGNNCKVGQSVEVKNSIIMDNTKLPHLSYIGDSVIGESVNVGAGTITANLRHDKANIRSSVNDVLTDTGRKKLGAIIGDGVHTGINTSIYPGRKIGPGKSTLPGEAVRKDIT